MDFVPGLKVGDVLPETFPHSDPLGAYIIKEIHGCSSTPCVRPPVLNIAVTLPIRKRDPSSETQTTVYGFIAIPGCLREFDDSAP
jgi:hypothetical protein